MLAQDGVSCILNSAQNPLSAGLGSSLLLFRLRWNFLRSLGVFHVRIWHGLPGRLLTRHSAACNDSIITSSSQLAELYGLVRAALAPLGYPALGQISFQGILPGWHRHAKVVEASVRQHRISRPLCGTHELIARGR